ncbi:MDR family MFS transporter [Fictibacillus phosphorivorans]|uniref:MDR family MFS transporter n=1 Tax=Fictibacillus phosphorivorans TaxID=1221500 RepID=UPI001292E3D2|nr:MDR family MFS transporter [Fictibacillus phosphorivorans]MQR96832.1 DHA2 family efflux MFS transporter permease subunit [Fictibacillus phosphorivorans]
MEHLEMRRKVIIMLSIMSAMLFAALNQTIVGTSLPKIIADLGGIEYYSWVFTIFMLTSSITAILVGKLSDIYGRKPFILLGIGVFTAGSLLCGISGSILELILFRGVQGFGGGMIMSTAFTAVGDLFPPRERGKWQGIMSSVFGLASVFGPTLGGYIVDHFHWHWVFWIFLPFGFVAFAAIYFLFPSVQRKEKESIDYTGSLLLTLTMVPLLLSFTWAGNQYDWVSPEIIGLFTVTIVAFFLFVATEKRVSSPVLPLDMFKNKVFTVSNIIGFFLGAGMFGSIMYMPFFIQGVMGTSATKSGFVMMPLTLAMVAGSTISGQIITKTGKYKKLAMLGLFIMVSGMTSMHFMDTQTTNTTAILNMILVGSGLGIAFPIFTLTVQNAIEHKYLGVETSSVQLFRQLGGTIGVSIMGSVMNNSLADHFNKESQKLVASSPSITPEMGAQIKQLANPQVLLNQEAVLEKFSALPPESLNVIKQVLGILRESLSFALNGVFLTGAIVIGTAFILTFFFLQEIPLRTSNEEKNSSHEQTSERKLG